MKTLKILISIGFILVNLKQLFPQTEWAPIGAKWNYSTPYYSPPYYTRYGPCIYIESIKDTIINDLNSKILEVKNCESNKIISREFIYQNGDSIFYYNQIEDEFYLLYNFSAGINDEIIVHDTKFKPVQGFLYEDSVYNFKYIIQHIDSINVDNIWLKRQLVAFSNNSEWGFSSFESDAYVVEKLGGMTYFFGRISGSYPEESIGLLRCYSDNYIDYKNPEWKWECDYVNTSVQLSKMNIYLEIFPNPFYDHIQFKRNTINSNLYVKLYDIKGRLLINMEVSEDFKINTSFLNNGFYILHIVNNDYYVNYKILKQ